MQFYLSLHICRRVQSSAHSSLTTVADTTVAIYYQPSNLCSTSYLSESASLKPSDAADDALSMVTDAAAPGDASAMDGEGGHDTPKTEEVAVIDNGIKDIWMDFEDFCKCFK